MAAAQQAAEKSKGEQPAGKKAEAPAVVASAPQAPAAAKAPDAAPKGPPAVPPAPAPAVAPPPAAVVPAPVRSGCGESRSAEACTAGGEGETAGTARPEPDFIDTVMNEPAYLAAAIGGVLLLGGLGLWAVRGRRRQGGDDGMVKIAPRLGRRRMRTPRHAARQPDAFGAKPSAVRTHRTRNLLLPAPSTAPAPAPAPDNDLDFGAKTPRPAPRPAAAAPAPTPRVPAPQSVQPTASPPPPNARSRHRRPGATGREPCRSRRGDKAPEPPMPDFLREAPAAPVPTDTTSPPGFQRDRFQSRSASSGRSRA